MSTKSPFMDPTEMKRIVDDVCQHRTSGRNWMPWKQAAQKLKVGECIPAPEDATLAQVSNMCCQQNRSRRWINPHGKIGAMTDPNGKVWIYCRELTLTEQEQRKDMIL